MWNRHAFPGSLAAGLVVALVFGGATDSASAATIAGNRALSLASQAPAGFDDLLLPQRTLIDVVYGGRRVGVAMATFTPDSVQFEDPAKVAALLPGLSSAQAVIGGLANPIPSHPNLVCAADQPSNCGRLSPEIVGVIFDDAHFRAELFVNPAFLQAAEASEPRYLPAPNANASLADTLGATVSGSAKRGASYSLQNRTVIGYRDARLSADVSQSSDLGFQVDTLVAAMDRPGVRYRAGLFWTPALDFYGQTRVYGVGVASQLDTRADLEQIAGNALVVFLPRRSQVDILRNGRLAVSKFYDAGNQILDTSNLPDGAYNITLRVREPGGATREMQQFFVKSRSLPPLGQPLYFLTAGVLADRASNPQGGNPERLFIAAGAARRVSSALAVSGTAVVAGGSVLAEVGATYLSERIHFHGSVDASIQGNVGLLFDATLQPLASLFLTVDVRKAWGAAPVGAVSSSGRENSSFNPVALTPENRLSGPSFQFRASVTYVVGPAQLGFTGAYQDSPSSPRTYSFGPSVNCPLWNSRDLALAFVANATLVNDSSQSYVGFRIQYTGANRSLHAEAGAETIADAGQGRRGGIAGSLTGVVTARDVLSSDLTATAALNRTADRDTAALGGQLRGAYGMYQVAAERDLNGANADTRYSASLLVGGALTPQGGAIGGEDTSESGIIARLDGNLEGLTADVLINGSRVGRIVVGQRLPIFLPPYKTYSVRLIPIGAPAVDFDTSEREVSLLPGNVETIIWRFEPVIAVFGRAVSDNGQPIAAARIEGARSPTSTDDRGYFQVEIAAGAKLILHDPVSGDCRIPLGAVAATYGYAAVGTVTC